MCNINKNTRFSSENQPSPEAKSKGKKAWWDEKKAYENARNDIYAAMLRKMGQTADGESALHEKIADNLLELVEPVKQEEIKGLTPDKIAAVAKDRMDVFLRYFKELQPEKPKETTLKGDRNNPLVVESIDEKDKAILAALQKEEE